MIRRILVTLLALVALVIAGFAIFVASRQHLKFDSAPYPDVTASTDSAVIARGHYIVRGLAPCASCHGDPKQREAAENGEEIALSGGYEFNIPPGKFRARNITPDPTGIGTFSDKAVGRALRYGVGHDGRALLPFMEMQGLSDEDLTAVVSYLRSRPPVHNEVPMHEYTLLGKIVKATVLANPVGPKETPLKVSPHGANVENGRYIVESVALCGSCHTQRNMATGAFEGPRFGGATGFDATDSLSWSPPNITSDSTGKLSQFTEDEFVARIRAGRVIPGSPMPWQSFRTMHEEDLRAIYRYLKTVPPVHRDVGPPLVLAAKKK